MLSVGSINAGQGGAAAAYYEGLAKEDYYTAGGEPPGQWVGQHAERLGLDGKTVQPGQLSRALEGYHPTIGEALAKNAGDKHKPGHDFTFSAPKSVSAVWITASDQQRQAISAAQQRAVESALKYAEQNAFHTRTGHAGEHHVKHDAGIAAATFEHSTSRNGDPQLHTHAIVLNLTPDGKRMDFDSRWKMSIGAAYRTELATELQKMGYAIEKDGTSFRIAGVPQELEKDLSTRRAEIVASLAEKGLAGNAKAAAVAALDTRNDKGEVSREKLVEQSRAIAAAHGFTPEAAEALRINSHDQPQPFDHAAFASAVTAQASTVSEQQLQAQFFQHAQITGMTIQEVQAKLTEIKQNDLVELVDRSTGETRWTTTEMLAIERGIADTAQRWKGEHTHPVRPESLQAAMSGKGLSLDQQRALEHIIKDERIAVVQGVAGAGKSYMLDTARDAWQRDGYHVVGCALSGKAAEGLQESAKIESDTIHSTLIKLEKGAEGKPDGLVLTSKSIVVMDEAGMTGSRLMHDLQRHVDASGAKLVLVGDTRQLQPVDAGGSMRAIQDRVGAAEMSEIRRQNTERGRDIVNDFAQGRAALAIQKLDADGHIKTSENAEQARAGMAAAVIQDMQDGKTAIALAGTRAEVHHLNQEARAAAQAASMVKGPDHAFEAERGNRQFAEGDRIIFLKNDRELGVKNGTTGTVEKAANGQLTVKLDNGKTAEFNQERYKDVDHGYAMTVHKSQGVTVDRAHYLPGRMSDAELNYVAGSRHRDTITIHTTKEGLQEFKDTAERSHAKNTSVDYLTRAQAEAHQQAYKPEIIAVEKQLESLKAFDQTKENYTNKADLAEARENAERRLDALKEGAAGRLPDRDTLQREVDAARQEAANATNYHENVKNSPSRDIYPEGYDKHVQTAGREREEANDRLAVAEARLAASVDVPPVPEPPSPPRFEPPSHDAQRDAELARDALATSGKMPEGKKLQADIENGRASWAQDSQGERYLRYQDGRTYNPDLHANKRETELRQAATLGLTTKKASIVDKHLIDTKVLGHRIQAIKTGTKVLISREGLAGKYAGAQKDAMRERHQREGKGGMPTRANDAIKNSVLTRMEGYRPATLQESIRARIGVTIENRATRNEARERLEGKIKDAEQRINAPAHANESREDLRKDVERAREQYQHLRDHPEPRLFENHSRSLNEARERLDKLEERYSSSLLSDMAEQQKHGRQQQQHHQPAPPPPAPEKSAPDNSKGGREFEM